MLGQNFRTPILINIKYLRPYCSMDKKISVISSSVIGAKISISRYQLNIFINDEKCCSKAPLSDSSLPGLLQTLQLRRKATSKRTWSPSSDLTLNQSVLVVKQIAVSFRNRFFQQSMHHDQDEPLESSS